MVMGMVREMGLEKGKVRERDWEMVMEMVN